MASKKKEEPDLEKGSFNEEVINTPAPDITQQEESSWASYRMSMQIGMDTTLRRLLEMLGAGMNITITMIDGKKKKFILVDVEEENSKGGC